MRLSDLSGNSISIKFIGREDEMRSALAHLNSDCAKSEGRLLIVRGDSGTGKTFFTKQLVQRIYEEQPSNLYLYIDIPNDGFVSSKAIETLLSLAMVPGSIMDSKPISVPDELTFQEYIRRSKRSDQNKNLLRVISQAIGNLLGVGPAVQAVVNSGSEQDESAKVADELRAYLSWVADRASVILVVDNIQFLSLGDRLSLESVLQRSSDEIRLVAIDRTVNSQTILDIPIRCFAENKLEIEITKLTEVETAELIRNTKGLDPDTASLLFHDVFTKTDGLAKDIEYCIRQYHIKLSDNAEVEAIEGLLSTISRLPEIHRQFLVISSMLDGGVDKRIALATVSRLTSLNRYQLNDIVDELVGSDYLLLDREQKEVLKPGHERIITSIRDLADEDLEIEVRSALLSELALAIQEATESESEAYLLHCFVGLQNANELIQDIDYVSRLVQSQYRQEQFSYLAILVDEIYEILHLLPNHVANDLLDALQKNSSFEKGLQVLSVFDSKQMPKSAKHDLFRMQYLTQAYRYEEALKLSDQLKDSEWLVVHRVNLLMALERSDEALSLTKAHLSSELSEAQAIQRRNTVSLFETNVALQHLDEAYSFFETNFSNFRLGTVDTNRSLVYLDNANYEEAGHCLDRAIQRMQLIRSPEIYQALLNQAIRFALIGQYDAAIRKFDESSSHVPHSLLFDRVKIDINRLVVQHIAGQISGDRCAGELALCSERIRGLQLPYLNKVIKANIACTREESSNFVWESADTVDLTAKLARDGINWGLPMSVHWRY